MVMIEFLMGEGEVRSQKKEDGIQMMGDASYKSTVEKMTHRGTGGYAAVPKAHLLCQRRIFVA